MNRLELIKKTILSASKPVFSFETMAQWIVSSMNDSGRASFETVTDTDGKERRCLRLGYVGRTLTYRDMTDFFKPEPGRYLHLYFEALNRRASIVTSWLQWINIKNSSGVITSIYPGTGACAEENVFSPLHFTSLDATAGIFKVYQNAGADEYTYIDIDSFKMWVDDSYKLS